jgi:hypothetical protein
MTRSRLLSLALLMAVGGCATRKTMLARPLDNGVKAAYPAAFDKVKRAAYDALSDLNFGVKDEKWDGRSENCWVINSSKGLSSGSAGQYARIVIEKTETEQTVYVVVESKAATRDSNAADEDTAKGIQARIEKRVTNK